MDMDKLVGCLKSLLCSRRVHRILITIIVLCNSAGLPVLVHKSVQLGSGQMRRIRTVIPG